MFVGAGEEGGIHRHAGDAGEAAGGVAEAARKHHVRLASADGLAHERQAGRVAAVPGEPFRSRDVAAAARGGIAGQDATRGVDDRHLEHDAGRQQALGAHRLEGAVRSVHLDRVLQHAQGLVDAAQAARHLRFVGGDQLAGGVACRRARRGFLLADHVQGGGPQRRHQQQREQGQRDVGLEPAHQRARQGRAARARDRGRCAGRRGMPGMRAGQAVHVQRSTRTGRTLSSSAARSI